MSNVSTLRSHSREFLTEVIELYKSYPCLWKMKSKEYSDREKKAEAYAVLVEKFKATAKGSETVDRNLVAKKINCLRSSYRLEKKKISDAAELGRVYYTNLWCFDLLRFLDENDKYQQRTPFVCADSADENSNDSLESREYLQISSDGCDDLPQPSAAAPSPDPDTPTSKHLKTSHPINIHLGKRRKTIGSFENTGKKRTTAIPARKRKRDLDAFYKLLGDKGSKARRIRRHNGGSSNLDLDEGMTQFDYASKAWAVTLNELPRTQQLYASRTINEVLFQAQLGKLNEDTRLVLSAPKAPEEIVTLECLDTDTVEFNVKGEV